MKRYIRSHAFALVDEFMKYHEDFDNYHRNPSGFDNMYKILSKYGSEDEDVDEVFNRASKEDQLKMIELIKPCPKFGQDGYAKFLYNQALDGAVTNASRDYCKGVVDMMKALLAEGYIVNEDEFEED